MKTVGTRSMVTLTKEKAQYWITHQANQRRQQEGHIAALAKLLARVGWRMDQSICLNEKGEIINGLQRLSAIMKIGDYGWKIPVVTFDSSEITKELLESFNVQTKDTMPNLMRRMYGWVDNRQTSIAQGIYASMILHENATTNDLADIYELIKDDFDKVLMVKKDHRPGCENVDIDTLVALVYLSNIGMNIDDFVKIECSEFIKGNKSGPYWRALHRYHVEEAAKKTVKKQETSGRTYKICRRVLTLKKILVGKPAPVISHIKQEELEEMSENIRSRFKTIFHK